MRIGTEGTEPKERTSEEPVEPKRDEEAWPTIPVEDFIDEGYKPYKRVKGDRAYITLKKGRHEKSLGVYTPERWTRINSLYQNAAPVEPPKGRLSEDDTVMAVLQGRVRGEGYLDELKNMFRAQVSRSRELTEFFYNVGLGTLLVALQKSGVSVDEFRRVSRNEGDLKKALTKASDTVFKAIERYDAERFERAEAERDYARAYASMLDAQLDEIKCNLDPKVRLGKMIYNLVLLSGTMNIDPNILVALVEKWIRLKALA